MIDKDHGILSDASAEGPPLNTAPICRRSTNSNPFRNHFATSFDFDVEVGE